MKHAGTNAEGLKGDTLRVGKHILESHSVLHSTLFRYNRRQIPS